MTAAARQQRKRDRQKAGLVLVQEWVPSHAVDAVRTAIQRAVADAETQKNERGVNGESGNDFETQKLER